ncbi:MAG: hypothetical protein QF464_09990 [Myxococcota bacterium]|nr:hypothetical protein [Myxococcota bacterium]
MIRASRVTRELPLERARVSARLASCLAAFVMALSSSATPAQAIELDFVIGLHGATFLPWEATHETGNGYGVSAGVNLNDLRLVGGLGGVLPASKTAGHFAVIFLEAQWHPLRHLFAEWGLPMTPYVVGGVSVAMADGLSGSDDPVPGDAVRWTADDTRFVGFAGLGFAVGAFDGFSVGVDMRIYNATYGGFVVSAAYAF